MQEATFKGKSVIIADAAYGIGRHLALAMGRAGARLLLTDVHPEGLRETCERIQDTGGEAHALWLNESSRPEGVLERARELFGRIDFACFTGGDGVLRVAPVMSAAPGAGE